MAIAAVLHGMATKKTTPTAAALPKKAVKKTASKQTAAKKTASKKTASNKAASKKAALPPEPEAPSSSSSKYRGSDRVVAVIGAFGFLGRRVLARLEDDPEVDRIVAVDVRSGVSSLDDGKADNHRAVLLQHPTVSAHILDLTTPGADRELADILRTEDAGALFHLAFLSTPTHHLEMAHELETIGTHYVLNAAREAGITRLVSLSSTMCYGARADNPAFLNEQHPLRPPPSRTLKDKADADEQARRFAADNKDIAVAVARLGAMVPTAKDHFWTRIFSRRFVPAVLGYDPLLQLMHPDDAVEALLAIWKSGARGAVNVVGKGYLPLSHILTRLERAPLYLPAGIGKSIIGTLWHAQLIDMPPHFFGFLRWPWLADDTKLKSLTGFIARHDLATVLTILAASRTTKEQA